MPRTSPVAYRWRDPARVSPQRRAELAAHDARFPDISDSRKGGHARGQEMRERAAARREKFAALRAADVPVDEAACQIEVSVKYARRMEQDRIRNAARDRDVPRTCTCRWTWLRTCGQWQLTASGVYCPWHTRDAA